MFNICLISPQHFAQMSNQNVFWQYGMSLFVLFVQQWLFSCLESITLEITNPLRIDTW